MNILEKIAERTKERVAAQKGIAPFARVRNEARWLCGEKNFSFPFEKNLRGDDIAFICEIKKASPSKGVIAADFPYVEIAREYEAAGAAAISVLTEPFWFHGSDGYLREIAGAVRVPLLRKDFTVDPYMIYEAKILGASAVLLICSILDKSELAEYMAIAHDLGLSVLVETHDEGEVEDALEIGARIIGVNNRCLKTFEVDISLSERLKKLVPPEVIFVSESGLSRAEDIEKLREIGADAALIGESFMRSGDKIAAIAELRGRGGGRKV
ncbi:MAG: indole-3-glycerol phosphate synthase TrpC [Defluviitaleaceae bacterium]|nr:indole-3-glycerol phosphate synthase TrpC [Defluviitaleaceae bacterium]